MYNYYEILEVAPTATLETIKKSYRRIAQVMHPDKGGDTEAFKLIVEAYEHLENAEKRSIYDQEWSVYNENPENCTVVKSSGNISSKSPSYSAKFKETHFKKSIEYQSNPLTYRKSIKYLKPFQSNIYEEVLPGNKILAHDIYSFMTLRAPFETVQKPTPLPKLIHLTPPLVVSLLLEFLQGKYTSKNLLEIISNYSYTFTKLKSTNKNLNSIILYEAILEIISYKNNIINDDLLKSIGKIYQYAKYNVENSIEFLSNLFQNKYYRNLMSQALHLYWLSKYSITKNILLEFTNDSAITKCIENLKEELEKLRQRNESTKDILELIRLARVLKDLETLVKLKRPIHCNDLAKFYRDKAFQLLEWIPVVVEVYENSNLALNVYFQVGACFQQASKYERTRNIQMADEKLALDMYRICISKNETIKPDIELYFLTHTLKLILNLSFENPITKAVIQGFQHRALSVANIFPFYIPIASNEYFFSPDEKPLHLMRALLQALNVIIDSIEKNKEEKSESKSFMLDHNYITVLYQTYEACLESWYNARHDPEIENTIRLKLMRELLSANHWSTYDLDLNLDSDWIPLERDKEGWIIPNRSAPSLYGNSQKYRSIDGVEIHHKTGQIEFSLRKCKDDELAFNNLLSIDDLKELFANNIRCGIFSLDAANPDMQYHPFNKMLVKPARLLRTQLQHSMLITDYLLKFFTSGNEVQGRYPYDMRALQNIIQHLPAYLKKIIEDYQKDASREGLHRFWIEMDEISVAKEKVENNKTVYAFDNARMVVKKNIMEFDDSGNMIDSEDNSEGWRFYVVQINQLQVINDNPSLLLQQPAIVFIDDTPSFFTFYDFELSLKWEDGLFKSIYELNNFRHLLKKLFKEKVNISNEIIKNSSNSHLIYRITKLIANQISVPHMFSPAYIFTQEFTSHYNEFAEYFPEFGRLRELSKAIALVDILDTHRNRINFEIKQLLKIFYESNFIEIKENITSVYSNNFKNWRAQFNRSLYDTKNRPQLYDIKRQINSTLFKTYDLAKPHLQNVFKVYSNCSGFDSAIYAFYQGDLSVFLNLMTNDALLQISTNIRNNHFSDHSIENINAALKGSNEALDAIINKDFLKEINKQRVQLRTRIDELRLTQNTFVKLGFQNDVDDKIDVDDDVCLWVPASINHDNRKLVYGGVSLLPKLSFLANGSQNSQLLLNQSFNSQTQSRMSASQMMNTSNSSGTGSSFGSNSNQGGGSGGNGNGGGSSNGGGSNRYVELASRVSKSEVRTLIQNGSAGLPVEQNRKILKTLQNGRMDHVTIKLMNTGDVRVVAERPGHTDGYQRFSFGINPQGEYTRIVQTAYSSDHKIQQTNYGAPKNNIYDVKL